jgi:hypothetical protein
VTANLDLVRSIYADWERGDFSSVRWAHPDIELGFVDGPERGMWKGVEELAAGWREFLGAWADYRVKVDTYRLLDADRVLVLLQHVGRGKASGVESSTLSTEGANLVQLREGTVTRVDLYWDRQRALADLGLAE